MGAAPAVAPAPVAAGQQQVVKQLTGLEPLSASSLASMSADQQKNMIGERLYPMINNLVPQGLAGKITGMLLEMDNSELLNLLESPDSLKSKVSDAMNVLEQYRKETGQGAQ